MQRFPTILAVALLSTAGFSRSDDLTISQVQIDRTQFNPSIGERVAVQFTINRPAAFTLRWFDGRDYMVREIRSDGTLSAGAHRLAWDGRDQAGRLVPGEAYRYALSARDESGLAARYDLTERTRGSEVQVHQVSWDPEKKMIRYRLPRTARVNIRVGLANNGPLMDTIIDWVPRPAGDQEEPWDGWDASNVLDLSHHPRLEIAVNAFALGDNAVIAGNNPSRIAVIEDMSWPVVHRETAAQQPKRMYYHSQQSLQERGDVQILLELPTSGKKTEQGDPIISGVVPVRLDVAPQDRQRALERRFEPVFFVDGTFTFENEVGFLPTTWLWDTAKVNEGIHYVTANLRGYEGNFGMATVRVVVVREEIK